MKCSHCSSDLQDTANTCPQCGASTSQHSPAQQHSGASSYLPAGTPPWPTTIPERQYANQARTNFATEQPVPTIPATSTNGKNYNLLKTVSILILAPILGSLITLGLLSANGQLKHIPSPISTTTLGIYNNSSIAANNADPRTVQAVTPTAITSRATAMATLTPTPDQTNSQPGPVATLPTDTNFKVYTNKDINLSLQYPSDWLMGQTSAANSAATTLPLQPPQSYSMQMYIEHLTNTFSTFYNDASELNRRNVQSLFRLQNAHDIQKASSPNTQPTIAGITWNQADATLQVGTSQKMHFTTLSVHHSGSYYSIYFLMPDSIYQAAMQKYIQPLLNSIKFLS